MSQGREKPKVAVAMSGGVDSSVAAALLVEQGYDVVGVHMKLIPPPTGPVKRRSCCSLDDSLDARQVSARLGIPFYVVDFQEAFKAQVVDYFVGAYAKGETPNPCVMCNQNIKAGALLEKVREFGCDLLATGHYAALGTHPETGQPQLLKPKDKRMDQTYFLIGTKAEELPYLLFPLADHEKPAARNQAESLGLITWDKPDSQDVCFVPGDYRDVLRKSLSKAPEPGDFVDENGKTLGAHKGLPFYTIGQRRGLGLSAPEPLYVLALRTEENQVVLGSEDALYLKTMQCNGVNWVSISPPRGPLEAVVKVRYAHEGTRAILTPASDGRWQVDFAEPVRAIAPGQAAAFYAGDVLLGGGWIQA